MNGTKRAVASPAVTVPAVVGGASLGLALLLGSPGGLFGIVGVCGLLVAIGAAFTRWVYFTGPLAEAVDRALQGQSEREHRARLDQLQRQLKDDPDPRARDNLDKLRRLRDRLQSGPSTAAADPLLAEVRDKSQELYESCLSSLERVAQQGGAARQMATPEARETLLHTRNELLDEVTRGVDRLGASVDQLQVSALANDAGHGNLAQIRNELDAGLEVARHVHERMDQLDRRVSDL